MATINKYTDAHGLTSYRVRIRMKGHPVQSATFKRKTDADKWAQQTESAIREGRYFQQVEAQRHSLAELIDRYTIRVLPEKKPKTQAAQRTQLAWWKDELGALTLAAITPTKVADCRDKLLDTGRTPSTTNRYLAVMSHAFSYAVMELRWLEDNPCRKVKNPKEPKGRNRFLSSDELNDAGKVIAEGERTRLLNACKASSCKVLYPAVLLAMSQA